MRIAIDTQSTLGRKTGIGIYTAELLAALRQIAPEHDYIDLNWGRDIPMRLDRRLRWQQWEVTQRARRAHADLLHVPGFDAPRFKTCPVVLTVHDVAGLILPLRLPPFSQFYWTRWMPASLRFASYLIADSEATRRDIIRLLHIRAERISVIHLGVGDQFTLQTPPAVAGCRARYQLPARFILFVGTHEPRKGVDILVDAFANLAAQTDADLVLAGRTDWYRPTLDAKIRAHGLDQRVHILEYVADADLPALYASATVFAFPSRYEGFGLPVLEAMRCGVPVVSSTAGSLAEVAGDAALLVPPEDVAATAHALNRILSDTALAEDLRQKGIRRSAGFTWEQTARATLNVYDKVIHT